MPVSSRVLGVGGEGFGLKVQGFGAAPLSVVVLRAVDEMSFSRWQLQVAAQAMFPS